MPWNLAVCGIFAMVMVCAGEVRNSNDLTITQLRRSSPTSTSLIVCYSDEGGGVYGGAKLEIRIVTPDPENKGIIVNVDAVPESECFTFENADIIKLVTSVTLDVEIVLHATQFDGNKDGIGSAYVTFPKAANFPKSWPVDRMGEADMKPKVLRLKDGFPTGQVFYMNKQFDSPKTCTGVSSKPCYFTDGPASFKNFYVCNPNIETTPGATPVLLCAEVEETDIAEPPKVNGIETVTIEHTGNKISFVTDTEKVTAPITKTEMVIQKDGDILKICLIPALTGSSCDDFTIELSLTYEIFITYTNDDDVASSYDKKTIKNRDLNGVALTPTIIEAYWSFEASEQYFQLSRDPIDGSAFSIADMDCSLLDVQCYSYFTGLTEKKEYTLTLGKIVSWGADPITLQSEQESIQVDTTTGERSDEQDSLLIHVETTTTSVTELNTEVDVCFNYVANASTKATHYELLAVNSKGMWKKIFGEKEKDEFHSCFYALDLLTADFNQNSKFLVLLRDTTNGNVIASGEAALNLQAPRAIKPEVDNGNNGSTSTLTIVGAAIGGIACLMALVAAAVMFVMKINRDNDGLQYPLHRTNIEQDSSYIHGLDNPIPTM